MADWAHGARREAARRRDGTPPRQRRRPHSTIDYHIPAEEMDALFERMDAMVAREEALPLAA